MQSSQSQFDHLPERDLELLSAYLDNQLTVAERMTLDRRLAAEPRLRAELEELQATTMLLRQLAPVRPPRSFTLDPTTAPRPRRFIPMSWFMQLGSGLAGLALVLLATVQLLVMGGVGVGMIPAAAPAPAALEADAPTVATMAESAPAASGAMAPAATPGADTAATGSQPPLAGSAGSTTQNGTGSPPAIDRTADALSAGAERQATPFEAPTPTVQPGGFPVGLTLALGLLLIALAVAWHFASRRGG